MNTGDAIRQRITELREQSKITEYRLTVRTDLAPSTVKSVLNQTSKSPQASTVTLICAGLGISVREFYNSPLFEDPQMAKEDAAERERSSRGE